MTEKEVAIARISIFLSDRVDCLRSMSARQNGVDEAGLTLDKIQSLLEQELLGWEE